MLPKASIRGTLVHNTSYRWLSGARIEAVYHGISSEKGSKVNAEYCDNIEYILSLSVGCRMRSQDIEILILGDVDQEYSEHIFDAGAKIDFYGLRFDGSMPDTHSW